MFWHFCMGTDTEIDTETDTEIDTETDTEIDTRACRMIKFTFDISI